MGNSTFPPDSVSYLLRHALYINKRLSFYFKMNKSFNSSIDLYAFVLADTKQKAANMLNIGFSFTWESGPALSFLGDLNT